ncbi:MAG: DUF3467 domain-containing protein [Terracidiphilus sp.]
MKTVWKTSEGRTSRSDGVNILATRPEVTLDFCYSEETGEAPDANPAPIVARIVMNPHMAKRLAEALSEVVVKHERIYGSIDEEALAGGKLLLSLVRDLGVPHGFEYSFKMGEGSLLANRFLITMGKASLGKDYQRRMIELCTKLRAPAPFLEEINASISEAYMVHFGFEASEKGGMHKVYLEYPLSVLTEPVLVHKSYKWDPLRPERRAVGRYVRQPLLTYEETAERVRDLLAECRKPGAFELADEFLRLAMPRLKKSFHYLEVTEEGTPRNSFDVNLYSASLTMGALRPLLLRMAERYAIDIEDFSARLDTIARKRFGHLTGGIDRDGRDFFTIHFGVKPRQQ